MSSYWTVSDRNILWDHVSEQNRSRWTLPTNENCHLDTVNSRSEEKVPLWNYFLGFPGGSVVKTDCQCRRHRLDSQSGKIPHAVEQLRPCATNTEPVLQSPGAASTQRMSCSYWSPQPRAPAPPQKIHSDEKAANHSREKREQQRGPVQPKANLKNTKTSFLKIQIWSATTRKNTKKFRMLKKKQLNIKYHHFFSNSLLKKKNVVLVIILCKLLRW